MKKLILVCTFGLVLGIATSASAALIDLGMATGSGEMRMYEIYNALYGDTLADNDALEAYENDLAIGSGLFTSTSGKIWRVARFAGATVTLKSYDSGGDHDIVTDLAGGTGFENPPTVSFAVTDSEAFGVWGQTTWGKFYSQKFLNSDNKYHFLVLNTPYPNKFLVGFEDKTDTSPGIDWDYNDFVFETEDIFAIPEPTSMLLLGMGILGLFGLKRKT
jgi:hypothetical protein